MKMCNSRVWIFCFLFWFPVVMPAQILSPNYMKYIRDYNEWAINHMIQYKIPASIKLAQAIVESNAGKSNLARKENNHFGIKCSPDWTGPCANYADDTPYDRFRVYRNVKESFDDHSLFLQKPNYSRLFQLDIMDYTGWAQGLQDCGYATSKNYANALIKVINQYELYRYDEKAMNIDKKPVDVAVRRPVYIDHGLLYVLAEANDSYARIAADLGFRTQKIAEYNEASEFFLLRQGDIVYLEKKLKRAKKPYFEHIVKAGESLHSISQLYGMQVKYLYKLNKKNLDYGLREGDALRLQ